MCRLLLSKHLIDSEQHYFSLGDNNRVLRKLRTQARYCPPQVIENNSYLALKISTSTVTLTGYRRIYARQGILRYLHHLFAPAHH